MSLNFLDFEQPIAELEAKIDSLTAVSRQDRLLNDLRGLIGSEQVELEFD